MAVLQTHNKQPWEVKDYDIDYSRWLARMQPADALSTATASVSCLSTPGDTALVVDSIIVTSTAVKFVVSGGTDGETYVLTSRVVTLGLGGIVRKDESELKFVVSDVQE